MDISSSQPERRAGLKYQPTVQDYLANDSGNIKVFGFTDASMDTSKSTNIGATTMDVSMESFKRDTNISVRSHDSGYSSFSDRTVPSADSALMFNSIGPQSAYIQTPRDRRKKETEVYNNPNFEEAVPGTSLAQPQPASTHSRGSVILTPARGDYHAKVYNAHRRQQQPYGGDVPNFNHPSAVPSSLQFPYPTTSSQNYSFQQYPQNPYSIPSSQDYSPQRYPQDPFLPPSQLHGPLQATHGQHDYHASRSSLPDYVTSFGPLGYHNTIQISGPRPSSVVVSQYDRRAEEIVSKPSFTSHPVITNQRRPLATQREYPREKKQGKIDRTAMLRARSQSPRLETEIERLSVSGKGEGRSKQFPSDPCNSEQGQIGGFAVTSPVDTPKSQHRAFKDILSEYRRTLKAESAGSTIELRHDAIIKTSNSEHVHSREAHEPQRARSSRNPVNDLSHISCGRDITVSTSVLKLLQELVPVDQSLSTTGQHARLLSSAHTSAGKDDTELNVTSQPRLGLDRSVPGSRTASNSANLGELQQHFSGKPSISSTKTLSTQTSSFNDTGNSGKHAETFLRLYDDSEEDLVKPDISMKSALDTAMSVVKGLLLRELLDCALPDAINSLGSPSSRSSRSKADSARTSISSNDSSNNSDPQQTRSGKRTRENKGNPGDTDGDDSDKDKDRPKKKSGKDPPERPIHGRLKCPFFQRQPERYTKAACRGRGFADMAKLKDHIKRVHTQPLRCSRCWLEMRSEDTYSEHLQQEEACAKNAEPQDDRIRPQLLKRLDFKKNPFTKGRNVEEKWKMMFSTIFPEDTEVPSPFEQHGMSPRLAQALSKALEEELSRELAPIIKPIMARIKGLIPAIINNCRLELMRTSPTSSEEIVLTPSTGSYGEGSSDGELARHETQPKHHSVRTPPRSSRSASQLFAIPKLDPTKTHHGLSEMIEPSSAVNTVNVEDQEDDMDISMFNPDRFNGMMCTQNENTYDYLDLDGNGGLFSLPLNLESDTSNPEVEGISAATSSSLFDPSSSFVP